MNTTMYSFKTRILDNILRSVKPTPIRNAFPEKGLLPKTQTRPLLQHHSMTLRSGGAFLAFRDLNKVGWDSRSMSVAAPSHLHDFCKFSRSYFPRIISVTTSWACIHHLCFSTPPGGDTQPHTWFPHTYFKTSGNKCSLDFTFLRTSGITGGFVPLTFSSFLSSSPIFTALSLPLSASFQRMKKKKEREKRNLHFKQDHLNSFSKTWGPWNFHLCGFTKAFPPLRSSSHYKKSATCYGESTALHLKSFYNYDFFSPHSTTLDGGTQWEYLYLRWEKLAQKRKT